MLGIYFHWPFCLSKCIYCDFGSEVVDCERFSLTFQQTYAECCKKQLLYFKSKIKQTDYNQYVGSVYFGGGTPSLIDATIIRDLIYFIKQEFDLVDDCEITIEANPTSCCLEKFENLSKCGINRISLGVQSFDNINLSFLGRKHSVNDAIRTIEDAKKIFPKWSFDLMYGLPRQNLGKWLEELNFAMAFQPQHISLYTLIVERDTLLGKMVDNGIIVPKSDDEMSEFYDATNDFFRNCQPEIQQYEVSNYAKKGYESRHNLTYWKSHDYIGIGAGAHGRMHYFSSNKRYETICISNSHKWIESIQQGGNGLIAENQLLPQEIAEEIIMMGLRIRYGIDIVDIQKRFNLNIMEFLKNEELNEMINKRLLVFNNNRLYVSKEGLPLLDSIVCRIVI